MELRHLRYFVAVAEELHFGRAAERLHIAQPPLSQQIKQFENELGFQLFYRTKRSVQLTAAGDRFLLDTYAIFQRLDQAVEAGRRISRGEQGKLAIGFVSSAAYSVLPPILLRFRAQFPAIALTLQELTTNVQIQQLQDNRLDVGFVRPPLDASMASTLSQQPILKEPFMVALAQSHPLAQQAQVAIADLASESFIIFPRSRAPGLYDQIISLCQQGSFSPQVVQEAVQMQTIVSLVAAGIGVALVPQSLHNLQRVGVVYRPLLESTPQAAIDLVWRTDERSPTLQHFLEIAAIAIP
jgi:DNA-binding transcriptional LysR family regulator